MKIFVKSAKNLDGILFKNYLTKIRASTIIKSSKGKQTKKGEYKMYGYYIDSEETADIIMSLTDEDLEALTKEWD